MAPLRGTVHIATFIELIISCRVLGQGDGSSFYAVPPALGYAAPVGPSSRPSAAAKVALQLRLQAGAPTSKAPQSLREVISEKLEFKFPSLSHG